MQVISLVCVSVLSNCAWIIWYVTVMDSRLIKKKNLENALLDAPVVDKT